MKKQAALGVLLAVIALGVLASTYWTGPVLGAWVVLQGFAGAVMVSAAGRLLGRAFPRPKEEG